jgi:hypothetical protein
VHAEHLMYGCPLNYSHPGRGGFPLGVVASTLREWVGWVAMPAVRCRRWPAAQATHTLPILALAARAQWVYAVTSKNARQLSDEIKARLHKRVRPLIWPPVGRLAAAPAVHRAPGPGKPWCKTCSAGVVTWTQQQRAGTEEGAAVRGAAPPPPLPLPPPPPRLQPMHPAAAAEDPRPRRRAPERRPAPGHPAPAPASCPSCRRRTSCSCSAWNPRSPSCPRPCS